MPIAFQVSKTPEYKRKSDSENQSVFVLFLSELTTALSRLLSKQGIDSTWDLKNHLALLLSLLILADLRLCWSGGDEVAAEVQE